LLRTLTLQRDNNDRLKPPTGNHAQEITHVEQRKEKDVPLIAISLAAIVFIAATLSLFPSKPRRRLIRFLTA
jgi:hypothetical protein